MFTGVLKDDCTEDQIMSAKKTVQVITEVNGHRYVSEFDGTGVVALTHKTDGIGCCVEGSTLCDSHAMTHFIDTLFKQLSVDNRMVLLLKLSFELGNRGGKKND
ncbi:hypothetical protein [Sporomusa sp.]|uniref:hypothetical protein n=1 Tax=Sporomusa sp. TaxID=2078658 RepID=UPI002C741C6E|nr:hypothetical protein [Sporomusa sp.]HWR06163.1 hypothetical protein [Sporomusa sp.]